MFKLITETRLRKMCVRFARRARKMYARLYGSTAVNAGLSYLDLTIDGSYYNVSLWRKPNPNDSIFDITSSLKKIKEEE